MENDAQTFFDSNKTVYSIWGNIDEFDRYLISNIKNSIKGDGVSLIDIGGGSGKLAKAIFSVCDNISVTVLDPSIELLKEIDDERINKITGMLPDQLNANSTYDYVTVKYVFHHVVDDSVSSSKESAKQSLLNIKKIMNCDGYLLIRELYYESYLKPDLTSNVIFFICKLQRKLKLKIPVQEFLNGLSVYFYTRHELTKIIEDSGFKIVDFYHESRHYPIHNRQRRILFLKEWGDMIFICKIK